MQQKEIIVFAQITSMYVQDYARTTHGNITWKILNGSYLPTWWWHPYHNLLQHHHICLSVEILSDLAWWKLLASFWNGTASVIPPKWRWWNGFKFYALNIRRWWNGFKFYALNIRTNYMAFYRQKKGLL